MKSPRRDVSLEADVRRMAGTRPFNLMPREALQLLAFSCEKRALKAGDTLFATEQLAEGAFLVLEGEIVLTGSASERRVGPGSLIGEAALLAEICRSFRATAHNDARLLEIRRETFRRVISEFPAAAATIKAQMASRLEKIIDALDQARARDFES